jgi:hypothetical protein
MRMICFQRNLCIAALFVATSVPALAQSSFSPSGVICGVVNFGFCDQGAPSAPPPSDAAPAFVPPPTDQRAEVAPTEDHKKSVKHKKAAVKKGLVKKASIKKAEPKVAAPDKPAD